MPKRSRLARRIFSALVLMLLSARGGADAGQSFVNFESGHVRPVAFVGGLLFAVNTPDNRLEVFRTDARAVPFPGRLSTGLVLAAEISVGLEPVAVAARNVVCLANGTCPYDVWVVNHLSDDVTAIRLSYEPIAKKVTVNSVDTIPTCDEPRDIVFAGKFVSAQGPPRAFVTSARRGQNCPLEPLLNESGVGRGLVQVFDIKTRTPLATLEMCVDKPRVFSGATKTKLCSDTPRGLASSADGRRVYAAGFLSGNRTTSISHTAVSSKGGLPQPAFGAANAPETGLIVQFKPANGRWEENGVRPPATVPKDWTSSVGLRLPDRDVFAIDAAAATPKVYRASSGVGTVLYNLAVRPIGNAGKKSQRDQIFVSNTEALNQIRFEDALQGHFATNRITVIDATASLAVPFGVRRNPFTGWSFAVSPVDLNPDIVANCKPPDCVDTQEQIDGRLALPNDMVFSADGKRLYVAALGSGAVGIFDAQQLSEGNPTNRQIVRTGGTPSGLALDAGKDRLYVMDRLRNSIVVLRNASGTPSVLGRVALFDPSGATVRKGRQFLYDAYTTSGHGDMACGTCHVYGDFDALAWDLGSRTGVPANNCNSFSFGASVNGSFHPLKGPMTTQSLRGMAGAGPLHWRGDKSGCTDQANVNPDQGQFNVPAGFQKFNGAFVGLLGRTSELDSNPGKEMDQFTAFALSIHYPPNPIRPLDKFSDSAAAGKTAYEERDVVAGRTCNDCHALPLGTNGMGTFDAEPQDFKVPHLRNIYQKVGMFGLTDPNVFNFPTTTAVDDQVRGFGVLHDGSVDRLHTFLSGPFSFESDAQRDNVRDFVFEFDTGMAPAVGQQVKVTKTSGDPAALIARADAGDCDLVARGRPGPSGSREVGYWYQPGDTPPSFLGDTAGVKLSPTALVQLISPAGWLTYTCVPPGSGRRIGIDRDCDGVLDGDETSSTPNPIADYPTGPCS